jgi:hypothetical protein
MFFFKKGRGALWVCIWNQGGGGLKSLGTTVLEKVPPPLKFSFGGHLIFL